MKKRTLKKLTNIFPSERINRPGINNYHPMTLPGVIVNVCEQDEIRELFSLVVEEKASLIISELPLGYTVYDKNSILPDFSCLNRKLETNDYERTITVETGMTLAEIAAEANKLSLQFPPAFYFPSYFTLADLIYRAPMMPTSDKYGSFKQYFLGLKMIMADGEDLHTERGHDFYGPNEDRIDFLLSNGKSLGLIVAAKLRLIPWERGEKGLLFGFTKYSEALDFAVNIVSKEPYLPARVEIFSRDFLGSDTADSPYHPYNVYVEIRGLEIETMLVVEDLMRTFSDKQKMILTDGFLTGRMKSVLSHNLAINEMTNELVFRVPIVQSEMERMINVMKQELGDRMSGFCTSYGSNEMVVKIKIEDPQINEIVTLFRQVKDLLNACKVEFSPIIDKYIGNNSVVDSVKTDNEQSLEEILISELSLDRILR